MFKSTYLHQNHSTHNFLVTWEKIRLMKVEVFFLGGGKSPVVMTVNYIWPFYKIGSICLNLESPGKYTYVSSKYKYVHINIQSFTS